MEERNNFAKGKVSTHILSIAGPMIVAQLINVLYNVIDRIYIGRIPHTSTLAMGGLGICLPIISIVIAFANLFGMGGAPLCSIGFIHSRMPASQVMCITTNKMYEFIF